MQKLVEGRENLLRSVERYKTELNNLVARDYEEQVTFFRIFKLWYFLNKHAGHILSRYRQVPTYGIFQSFRMPDT